MPNIPFVGANWGETLNKSMNGGFDDIMNGLASRRQSQDADLSFTAQTGYDRKSLLRGKEVEAEKAANPSAPVSAADQGMWGEWQNFNTAMKGMRIDKAAESHATARLKNANAGMIEHWAAGGGDDKPSFYTDPTTGMSVMATPGMKGTKYSVPGGQNSPMEEKRAGNHVRTAVTELDNIEKIYKSPEGAAALLKAGGSFSNLASLGDPTAQRLASAVRRASMASTYLNTGMAATETEVEQFFGRIANRAADIDVNIENIGHERRILQGFESNIATGRAHNMAAALPVHKDNAKPAAPAPVAAPKAPAAGAGARFAELKAKGMDKKSIYAQMHKEGF